MSKEKLNRIPPKDPVSGGELYISELACDESGVTIRGRFEIPRYARLEPEQAHFLETFLKCRGMLNAVERELGLSYPTVRARLDNLLHALGFDGFLKEEARPREKNQEKKRQILDQLERGEITPAEAKARLKEGVLS
jgi:hypothetical protein